MAKPRLTQAQAEASGAALIHPGRFKDRKAPKRTRPLGEPYKTMTPEQCAVWSEMAWDMPWLNSGHRILVRLACYHAARLDEGGEFGVSATTALSAILSKLGATPTDETKVNHDYGDESDPTDEYFGRSS